MDTFLEDPVSKYSVGQTVNCAVLSVEGDRIGLSLKQSLAASTVTVLYAILAFLLEHTGLVFLGDLL